MATVCLVWGELAIGHWEDLGAAAFGTIVISLAGRVLCCVSLFKTVAGRWVAIVGTPLVVIWLVKLVLFFACQIYLLDEEYDEEFPWSNYSSQLDYAAPSFWGLADSRAPLRHG